VTQLDAPPSALLGDAYANDRARVFHSWSVQSALDPTVIAGASGSRFWDPDGTTWIDFTSMLVNMNLGHQHPKMIQAIKDQADVLCMVAPPFANDQRSEAARLIVEKANRDGAGEDTSRRCSSRTPAPRPSRTRCVSPRATRAG
jgi:taurine---2-oxoglutarate transaminase